jgi:hypothetical protein
MDFISIPNRWVARALKMLFCSGVGPPSMSTSPIRPPTIACDIGCGRGKGILVLVTLFWIVFIKEFPGTDFLGDISQNIMHIF